MNRIPPALIHQRRAGFTLVELVTTMAAGMAIVLAMGFIMFDNQRYWNAAYGRANGDPAIDRFVAQTVFDSVVRKSSKQYAWIDSDAQTLRLFYYDDTPTPAPTQYAQFDVKNDTLVVTYGTLKPGTYTPNGSLSEVRLCDSVKDIHFALAGTDVLMTLTLADQPNDRVVTCSAVRYCP